MESRKDGGNNQSESDLITLQSPSNNKLSLLTQHLTPPTTSTNNLVHQVNTPAHVKDAVAVIDCFQELFDFYDEDGNGKITREELLKVLALCAREMGLEVDSYLEQIVDAVFSNASLTECGSITCDSLKEVLRSRPTLINELSLLKSLSSTRGANNKPGDSTNIGEQSSNTSQFHHNAMSGWDCLVTWLGKRFPLCNKLRTDYICNNLVRFNFFLSIMLINLFLIIGRIYSYWSKCGFLILARVSGQCLNFFCSIIVLLVCRRTLSYLRTRSLGRYLPIDDHVYFHKMMGLFIVGHSVSHTLGHVVNFYLESIKPDAKFTLVEFLFSTQPGIGWMGSCAVSTGWFLLVIIIIMTAAEPFSRRLGKFELFYYTHLLYIPFWVLLFVHAPRYWIWFLGPFTLFAMETLIRLRNVITNITAVDHTTIIKAVPLPSNVIHLVIKRPANFDYNPGDWIYVLIPQIAKYEWHPFTISSAPEQEGVIWLHIRVVGEWTKCLQSYFEGLEHRNHLSKFIKSGQFSISMEQFSGVLDLTAPDSASILGNTKVRDRISQFRQSKALAPIPENKSIEPILTEASSCETSLDTTTKSNKSCSSTILPNIKIFIDGPYGSPSNQIFRAEHAVLIATGIGVTPFASILQSIVLHYEKRRQKCPNCAHDFLDTRPPFEFKLRKVDFVWINRDQKSFEWFIKLLAELELTQSHLPANERFLDIHIHLTAMAPAQIKSVGLQLALYLVHEKNKKDLVTGLRTRTKVGRPNWDEFFELIQEQKKGKVSVFFCGRPQLGHLLHRQCDSFGFKFRKEIF